MSGLSLPAELEPHADDYSDINGPGVYMLELTKPDDIASEWDREFDHRPEWFEQLTDASRVLYVGASKRVLSRLEDHRDGQVRLTVLTRVCDVSSVENVWFYDSAEKAFQAEYNHAAEVSRQMVDDVFVLTDGKPV
jgi:predicted GIY-YIG superfamily endonuclease